MTIPLWVRNRSRIEQRVIAWLRGEDDLDLAVEHRAGFARLRLAASEAGFNIQSPGTTYLCEDERLLLAWLSQGQRRTRDHECPTLLRPVVAETSAILDVAGVRLPRLIHYVRKHHVAESLQRSK